MNATCQRCGQPWVVDDPVFVTCPACRLHSDRSDEVKPRKHWPIEGWHLKRRGENNNPAWDNSVRSSEGE